MRRMLTAAVLLACATAHASAQTYPSRPVTIVVPYAAGGNTDEGPPDVGGLAGTSSGGGGNGGEPEPEPEPEVTDPRPWFSFFVTSQAGLFALPAGEVAPAPDPANGYGGNLGGLAGADEICTLLARASNPGDQKTWRAFLSTVTGSIW